MKKFTCVADIGDLPEGFFEAFEGLTKLADSV